MSKIVTTAVEELRSAVGQALTAAMAAGELPQAEIPAFALEVPADRSHGDWACNAAMVGARAFHAAPRKIAEILQAHLDLSGSYFASCEIAGPGFLNFKYDPRFYGAVLEDIQRLGAAYGASDYGRGKRVLVEFVSANPTGPMHIGNARGGVLGDALSSVLEAAGYRVEREFYVNDAGNQVNKYGLSMEARYLQLFLGEDRVEFPEDGYLGPDVIENARLFAELHGDRYVQADPEERRRAMTDFAIPRNIQGLHDDLLRYRVEYDHWFHESKLHADGSVARVVEELKARGATYEKEGAVWFKGEEYGSEDFVLVRSNGVPTYVVPDIAYHYDKLVTRNFDKAINVLGADHHGYVPRLKAALTALGVDASKLDVVLMQMVRLVRGGETVKLSKRSGKAITLVTLLDEIPIDAARFYFNLREANSQFEFDLDLAVEKSSQNPVFYVQYAHARICSLMANLESEGIAVPETADLTVLDNPREIELIRHIASLPHEIELAAKSYDPAKMTKYAIDLATLFHRFYDACSVKNAETKELRSARILLCKAVLQTLRNVLTLLNITQPEKM